MNVVMVVVVIIVETVVEAVGEIQGEDKVDVVGVPNAILIVVYVDI
jgi:hypothetical protein